MTGPAATVAGSLRIMKEIIREADKLPIEFLLDLAANTEDMQIRINALTTVKMVLNIMHENLVLRQENERASEADD